MSVPPPRRAILIRVAVDATSGGWHGPCDPRTGDFVYVPIPQNKPNVPAMAREYDPIIGPALQAFSVRNGVRVDLPDHLRGRRMHLDPDFDYLTYGDTERRGKKLLDFAKGDFVVFYAALRAVQPKARLVYGLIGLLVVDSVRQVASIPEREYDRNAHTRLLNRTDTDIVVTGQSGASGRFARYVDIGELRNRIYRVRRDVLAQWGDLSVTDGWIQRSANPPLFLQPGRFAKWLKAQDPVLLTTNNYPR